jgi:hypothetical protein
MASVLGIELDILSCLGPLGDNDEKRAVAGRRADLYRVRDPEGNAGARSRMRARLCARAACVRVRACLLNCVRTYAHGRAGDTAAYGEEQNYHFWVRWP